MSFPTGVIEIRKSSDEELKTMLEESREAPKHLRKLGIVMGIVADHRLQQLRQFQAREQLATWRRAHGYDRDDSWMHGTRLLSPEEFTQSLWSEVNALKDAILMARQKVRNLINAIEQGKVSDEEFATLKRLVEKRDREAAQVAVTPFSTAQHCIPRSLNPESPSDVHVKMEEKEEGKMDPELKELKSSSAGTGFETPGQQCPNEETLEAGRTTAAGFVTACVGSSQGRNISSSTTESISVDTQASTKITATLADTSSSTEHVGTLAATTATPENRRRKAPSEDNKQFDPGGKGEKLPPWNTAVILFSFIGGALGHGRLVVYALCSLCTVCVLCFPKLFFYPGDHFSAKLKDMRGDADQVADVRNRRASIFSPITLLKMARTNNARFDRSANALG